MSHLRTILASSSVMIERAMFLVGAAGCKGLSAIAMETMLEKSPEPISFTALYLSLKIEPLTRVVSTVLSIVKLVSSPK